MKSIKAKKEKHKNFKPEYYPTIMAVILGVAIGTLTNYKLIFTVPSFIVGYYIGYFLYKKSRNKLSPDLR